jgi:putative acetyltransferase
METSRALLRPATEADVAEAARIWHQGWWDGHQSLAGQLGAERTPASFVPRMAQRIPHTTVAEAGGQVVGFAVVVGDELEQLYVDRGARGTGVARELIAHAERTVAAAGHRVAWLAVAEANDVAQRFYRKAGWRDAGPLEYRAETAGGFEPVACRRYERDVR